MAEVQNPDWGTIEAGLEAVVAAGMASTDIMLATDLALDSIFASEGVARFLGYETADILGHTSPENLHLTTSISS